LLGGLGNEDRGFDFAFDKAIAFFGALTIRLEPVDDARSLGTFADAGAKTTLGLFTPTTLTM